MPTIGDAIRLQQQPCPCCGWPLSGASQVVRDDQKITRFRPPKRGDLTVCIYCSEVLTVARNRLLVRAPPELIERVAKENPEQARIIALARMATQAAMARPIPRRQRN